MVMDTVAHNYQQQTVWIINTETDKSKSLQESEQHDVQFEKAVSETGTGMFHITIAIVCGFCFMAAGLQNNLNAYILPSAGCDMKLTSNEMGLLNAVFLAGGLSSGFIWGVLADMIGRKKILITGMVVDATLVLLSSFSQRFFVLLVFRYLNGFIIGGPSALVLAYMGEFFSEKLRTKVICYVGLLWTLSWVIMPGVAWLVIPMQFHFTFGDGIVFNSWRLLVALVGLPSILSAFLLYLYPESPRWLLSQGRAQEARDVLANVYSWNTGESADKYPVKSLCCEEKASTTNKDSSSAWQAISMLIQQGQSLFVMPVLKTTALTSALMFANMFGYYGLGLWLPELFNRFENHYAQHPHTSVSVCELSSSMTSSASDFQTCDSTAVDTTVFLNSLIIGVAGLSGNLASGFLSGKLQRRTMPIVLQLLSGLCVLTIYYLTNSFQNLIVSAAFQLCVGTANLVYNSLVVDMFPPSISGMGVCLAILSGRLGAMVSNLVFGHLLDISCAVPILLVAAVSAGGGLLSFFIPNEPYSEDKTSEEKKSVPA